MFDIKFALLLLKLTKYMLKACNNVFANQNKNIEIVEDKMIFLPVNFNYNSYNSYSITMTSPLAVFVFDGVFSLLDCLAWSGGSVSASTSITITSDLLLEFPVLF